MDGTLSRRDFLRLSGFSAAGLALRPPPPLAEQAAGLGRVADTYIWLYAEPSFRAPRLARLTRDTLLNIQARVLSDDGPAHNPLWYELPDGFVHSGRIQPVRWEPQRPTSAIPEGGGIFEVSVPFTRTYRKPDPASDPLYRLYFQSTAWVEALVEGADGRAWYRLLDDLLNVRYYARAEHLRRVHPEELAPISPHIPASEKLLKVSLAEQEVRAYERGKLVLRTRIASGVASRKPISNGIPTETPRGRFHIDMKMPLRHMGNGRLTPDPEAYELPGVPWVSYFTSTGVGFHGTYWHADFGRPMSHGCVNMRPEEAKWIFRWSAPISVPDTRLQSGRGTLVIIY